MGLEFGANHISLADMPCGNQPGDEMFEYFRTRLPPDLSPKHYEHCKHGFSCVGFARLLVMELGGPTQARILWSWDRLHAYVIRTTGDDNELVYNRFKGEVVTVGQLRKTSLDLTEEFFSYSWNEC